MIEQDEFKVIHARAAGLDVHKMGITATVRWINDDGAAMTETTDFSALPSGVDEMIRWLIERHVDSAMMEGTGIYWIRPFEALEEAGISVQLVHAQQVKQIKGRKTDAADSAWLARVCQYGLAMPSFVPPRAFREVRNLMRHRRKLTHQRVSVGNRVHKLLDRNGIQIGGILSDIFGVNGRTILDGLRRGDDKETIVPKLTGHVKKKVERLKDPLTRVLSTMDRMLLGDLLDERDALTSRINLFAAKASMCLLPWQRQLDLMQTIPGIDNIASMELLAEIGPDLDEFGSPSRLSSWAGVCPGNNESGGKRRPASIRHGNSYARSILNQCAHAAVRSKYCQFEEFHQTHVSKLGYKRSIVAVARRLIRVVYAVLRDDTHYIDPVVDYEAVKVARNAPRWIRQLEDHGFI